MKYTTAILSSLCLVSCKTPVDPRISRLVDLSISVAEREHAITKQDADDIRAVETIILTPSALPTIQTTSGK